MREEFCRTEMLLGREAMERLARSRVAVFGVGGVGGYVCEALARSGVGALDLIDKDTVALSNINRQIIATHETVGRKKTDVMRERILSINPEAQVRVYPCFFLPENADSFPFAEYDYVVDAVDTVTAKIELVMRAKEAGVPIISSMGAGNKLDPLAFRVADLYETKVCPLARVMRRELKKRNVTHLKVVYSEEEPLTPLQGAADETEVRDGGAAECLPDEGVPRRQTPGSAAFVPSVAGLLIAGEVVKELSLAVPPLL
ncbi:MAG: tRNA threonylcarbamoyladenosine dehydratase [Bacteroidales bacterium]|nr:tRNA threonylcarbamoyladenosine dehydratase [Bacteroidales bacterium]MCM1415093.1 tRNA threonylcarbamoyladenosine dehydratase [bacterium]